MNNYQLNEVRALEDPGLAALVTIARFHNIAADAAQLKHEAAITTGQFTDKDLILRRAASALRRAVFPFAPRN